MMDTLSMNRLLLIEFRWKPINRIKVINILNDGYLFIWPQQMHHLYNVAQSLLYCLVLVLQSFILWIWGSLYHSELCTIISREPNKQDTALTYFADEFWMWLLLYFIISNHDHFKAAFVVQLSCIIEWVYCEQWKDWYNFSILNLTGPIFLHVIGLLRNLVAEV